MDVTEYFQVFLSKWISLKLSMCSYKMDDWIFPGFLIKWMTEYFHIFLYMDMTEYFHVIL